MTATRTRNVVQIDEEKCDGCGQCVIACAEGAIQIVDGKARLVSERYCDGLGACLGECPQGAITVEQRPAEDYDVEATREHLKSIGRDPNDAHDPSKSGHDQPHPPQVAAQQSHGHAHAGCPSAVARAFTPAASETRHTGQTSALGQWPVQLRLVPPNAPYFQGADLLVTADCVPFAYADYHADLLAGKAVVVGCPKLDDAQFYIDKLAAVLTASDIRSITVAVMEVPCCGGLVRIAREALAQSGKDISLEVATITVRGEKQEPVAA
jgi:Pyruvate/2-oxoacid:ferredoxin oxidoreductase delta subunit